MQPLVAVHPDTATVTGAPDVTAGTGTADSAPTGIAGGTQPPTASVVSRSIVVGRGSGAFVFVGLGVGSSADVVVGGEVSGVGGDDGVLEVVGLGAFVFVGLGVGSSAVVIVRVGVADTVGDGDEEVSGGAVGGGAHSDGVGAEVGGSAGSDAAMVATAAAVGVGDAVVTGTTSLLGPTGTPTLRLHARAAPTTGPLDSRP